MGSCLPFLEHIALSRLSVEWELHENELTYKNDSVIDLINHCRFLMHTDAIYYCVQRPLAPHGRTSPFEDTGSPISEEAT